MKEKSFFQNNFMGEINRFGNKPKVAITVHDK